MIDLGLALGTVKPLGAIERLSVARNTNEYGNVVLSEAQPQIGTAALVGPEEDVVGSPYMRGIDTFAQAGIGCSATSLANEVFTWYIAATESCDPCVSCLGLYMKTDIVAPILVHNFRLGTDGGYRTGCGAMHVPCTTAVQNFPRGGLGTDVATECSQALWFMAPFDSGDAKVNAMGLFYKRDAKMTPSLVQSFGIDTSVATSIQHDVILSRELVLEDDSVTGAMHAIWKTPVDSAVAVTTDGSWYIAPFVLDDLVFSLAVYHRSDTGAVYLVHAFSLDVVYIPQLYMRFVTVVEDGGLAMRASGGDTWFFASYTTDAYSMLGMYYRNPSGEVMLAHAFSLSEFNDDTVAQETFIGGGLGTSVTSGGMTTTWFFAPDTTDDGTVSILGLYCRRTSSAAPTLAHQFIVDTVYMLPVDSQQSGPVDPPSDFEYDPQSGTGHDIVPHRRPLWQLPEDVPMVFSTGPNVSDAWYLTQNANNVVLTYKSSVGDVYAVHDFSA